MNISGPFVRRPVASSLLAVATLLAGWLGYFNLPVASLPQVDFPTIQVSTELPGGSPDTMEALVTAPLERQFGQIPSLQVMSSSSSFGISQVTLQFDLGRDIDGAAQDVQAAINAARSTLPNDLPYPPTYSKVNPADAPIITLALTSQTIAVREMSDMADTLMAQRLSEISGVGRVSVQGGIKPAVRIQADLARLSAYGIGLDDDPHRRHRRQCRRAARRARWRHAILHHRLQRPARSRLAISRPRGRLSRQCAGPAARRGATVVDGLENARVAGWYDGKPAVIIDVQRQPGANVIETVERIRQELPRLQNAIPAGVDLTVVQDRTETIRASIFDVQFTLVLAVFLVVLVVLVFLRTGRATLVAGISLPLTIVATFGIMWFCGFSLNNLSLMALTIGTGLRGGRCDRDDREHRAPRREAASGRSRPRSRARRRSASRSSR